eukprot:6367497-Pyramimonas_sp.AAC.1
MGINQGDLEGAKIMKDLQRDIDFGEVKYARQEKATFCGRAYQQGKDGCAHVTVQAYAKSMHIVRVPRDRSEAPGSALTLAEHRGLRMVLGQLQWAARMIYSEEAFEASRLASALEAPTAKDLQGGNAAIRRIQTRDDVMIEFTAGLNLWKTMVINVTDSAFDNLAKHGSQRGHFIMLGDEKSNEDRGNKYKLRCIGWQSSRIPRVVRSTLSAEACSRADS